MKLKYFVLTVVILINSGCDLNKQIDEAIIDISGKVTDEGQPVGGALVLLVESTEVSEGFSLANGSVTSSNGNYIILDVDEGDYYILAVDDVNSNLQFDTDTDRIGFYGVNPSANDIIPDQITISDQDIEDIDIVDLYSL